MSEIPSSASVAFDSVMLIKLNFYFPMLVTSTFIMHLLLCFLCLHMASPNQERIHLYHGSLGQIYLGSLICEHGFQSHKVFIGTCEKHYYNGITNLGKILCKIEVYKRVRNVDRSLLTYLSALLSLVFVQYFCLLAYHLLLK